MEYKHEAYGSQRKKPMWLLWLLAAAAVILAAAGLYRVISDRKGSNDGGEKPGMEDQQGTQGEQQTPGDEADVLAKAELLSKSYFYDEAIEVLNGLDSDQAKAKAAEYQALKDALVPYNGQYYHVFFHSLIINTDLAFDDKGHPAEGYNMWMTTVSEFKKMIQIMYDKGYVLVSPHDMAVINDDGTMSRGKIMLPEGKIPFVLSEDDVSYYHYMDGDGFATKLVIDAGAP